MRRPRSILFLVAVPALLAAGCGDATEITVSSVAQGLGDPVTSAPSPGVVVTTRPETVVSVVVEPRLTIKFWTTETEPGRVEAAKAIIDRFTSATGIGVDLTTTGADQIQGLMTTNAASGTLPDVVLHPIELTAGWAARDLLDAGAAQEVVDELGAATFSPRALELATLDDMVAAVPTDGWGQLLVYRKDLFDAADLDPPDTFAAIDAAAEELHDPRDDFYGIAVSTADGEALTQQTFEHLALANGCELVDDSGEVTLGSDECVEAMTFLTNLVDDYGPPAIQDGAAARDTYLAGEAGMVVWPPAILDELAGLRDSALPTCSECGDDPGYLAENSGIVTALRGPGGERAQLGHVSLLGIGNTGDDEKTAAAREFVEFWLSDGYLDWLATAPETKLPMRRGTADDPAEFVDGWRALPTGVDRGAVLADAYPAGTVEALLATESFDRWGVDEGQGELLDTIYESLPVAEAIAAVLDGDDVDDTIDDLVAAVERELEQLEG